MFISFILQRGSLTSVRISKGNENMAACGQLGDITSRKK